MPSALATSLPDETQAGVPGRTCFLASSPQVVAAGLQLEAGRPASFRVSVALPPQQLPPSFAGHAASYEYVLLLYEYVLSGLLPSEPSEPSMLPTTPSAPCWARELPHEL